jgi:hypothetical protein
MNGIPTHTRPIGNLLPAFLRFKNLRDELYYHVIEGHYRRTGENLKNLDYCKLVSEIASSKVEDVAIHFFTALPTHLDQGKQYRHQNYTARLQATGARIYEGKFREEP